MSRMMKRTSTEEWYEYKFLSDGAVVGVSFSTRTTSDNYIVNLTIINKEISVPIDIVRTLTTALQDFLDVYDKTGVSSAKVN